MPLTSLNYIRFKANATKNYTTHFYIISSIISWKRRMDQIYKNYTKAHTYTNNNQPISTDLVLPQRSSQQSYS